MADSKLIPLTTAPVGNDGFSFRVRVIFLYFWDADDEIKDANGVVVITHPFKDMDQEAAALQDVHQLFTADDIFALEEGRAAWEPDAVEVRSRNPNLGELLAALQNKLNKRKPIFEAELRQEFAFVGLKVDVPEARG